MTVFSFAAKSLSVRSRLRVTHWEVVPAVTGVIAATFLALPAAAQDADRTLVLRAGTTAAWDTNVFRQPESAPDPQLERGISGKADRVTTSYVGLHVDKPYAQQRLQLDVSQTATRHAKFSFIDRDTFQYHGGWLWTLTPRISGTLSADHSESAIDFADITSPSPQLNVRTTDDRAVNLDGWVSGGWHLLLGAASKDLKTSQLFLAQPGSSVKLGSIGLEYVAESGNSISALRRSTRGEYALPAEISLLNSIGRDFAVEESGLTWTWMVSGKSTLNGQLFRMERRTVDVPQRDFSGTTGQLAYVWLLTDTLTLNVSAIRNLMPWTADTQASYRVDDTLAIAPSWKISNQIDVYLRASRLVNDFRGPIVPVTGPLRRDVLRSVEVGMHWSPLRNVAFGATLRRDRRSSTITDFEFEDTVAGLNVALTF